MDVVVQERRSLTAMRRVAFAADRRRLRVGLVNNMPDTALAATERQFRTLAEAAAPGRRVELVLFHIPQVARGPDAERRLARYRPVEAVEHAGLDALIVTGAEPRAADLRAEPFWPALARLADWAREQGPPSLWSCLAAHAAVLHLDGVERRPLAAKCSGLFDCVPVREADGGDRLLDGLEAPWVAPHSRANALPETELAARGYRVLTRSPEAGVDAFVRLSGRGAPMLMLQGHPEYDVASLALEFKRDLQRYLDAQRDSPPALPCGVFGERTAERLEALVRDAMSDRRPALMARWPAQMVLAQNTWREPAVRLLRNWLMTPVHDDISVAQGWNGGRSRA